MGKLRVGTCSSPCWTLAANPKGLLQLVAGNPQISMLALMRADEEVGNRPEVSLGLSWLTHSG